MTQVSVVAICKMSATWDGGETALWREVPFSPGYIVEAIHSGDHYILVGKDGQRITCRDFYTRTENTPQR